MATKYYFEYFADFNFKPYLLIYFRRLQDALLIFQREYLMALFSSNIDNMRDTYEDLKNLEAAGHLNEESKGMLDKLKVHFEN